MIVAVDEETNGYHKTGLGWKRNAFRSSLISVTKPDLPAHSFLGRIVMVIIALFLIAFMFRTYVL
jgi:hypothetical protein